MAQFESMREQLHAAGLELVFIAGQSRKGLLGAERYFRNNSARVIPYLCDSRREVLRAYGVYHGFALDGVRVARPSVFLIDSGSIVRFIYVGKDRYDRIAPEQLLAEYEKRMPVRTRAATTP